MAKRRKETEDEEEKVDFKMPKFDEEAFVRKEKEKIKTTFISFVFGWDSGHFSQEILLNGPLSYYLVSSQQHGSIISLDGSTLISRG